MSFKSNPVAVGTDSTTVYECPAGTEAAGKVGIANISGAAATYDLLFYSAVLDQTITLASAISIPANTEVAAYPAPLSFVGGDKLSARASVANAVTVFATVVENNQGPQFTGISPKGEWASGTTYATNDMVSLNGTSYLSRIDGNVGNSPDTSTADWVVLAAALQTVPDDSVTDAKVATSATATDGIDIAKMRYNQGDTNAVTRFAIARLRDSRHLADFGLLGVNYTQDTTILTNAIGALADGGELILPAGKFYAEQEISVTSTVAKGIALRGAGKDATELVWVNDTFGIDINLANQQVIDISDVGFKSDVAMTGTNTALVISSGGTSGSSKSSSLRRLSFTGTDSYPYAKGFAYGLDIFGLSFLSIEDVDVFGGTHLPNGINLRGAANHIPIVTDLSKCRMINCNNGIFYNSYLQGVTINQCNFTNGNTGILVPSSADGTVNAQLVVANSQFNTDLNQIDIQDDIIGVFIHDNDMIVPAGKAGVSIAGGSFYNIHHNNFFNPLGVSGGYGVNASANASGYPNIIDANTYQKLDYGNVLGSGSSNWKVTGANKYASDVTTPNSDSGTENIVSQVTAANPGASTDDNGLQRRWGSVSGTVGAGNRVAVSFSSAFKTACLNVTVSNGKASVDAASPFIADLFTTSGFSCYIPSATSGDSVIINYEAVGH